MTHKIVDARGLACPQPVIRTRNALRESNEVTTIVDNETARENVTRMAEKAGCSVTVEPRADGICLHIRNPQTSEVLQTSEAFSGSGPLVLVIPGDTMGRGDETLGGILVRAFLHTLGEVAPLPETVILFNSGVKLAVGGSPALDDLRALQEKGITILACGTCLGYYELKDKIAVGEISNMYTIAETMLRAGKVISL